MSSRSRHRAADAGGTAATDPFLVFVEGPRDRDILRSWARQLSATLARRLVEATIILGGRQPARAVARLRELADGGRPARGLCVLDRDGCPAPEIPQTEGVDLELFTWGRRHIESYLLVPSAIRRGLRVPVGNGSLDRLLRAHLPAWHDEAAWREVDAKRILHRAGPISRLTGRPVNPGRIARAMRPEEFHPEVHGLLARIEDGFGLAGPEAVVRVRARSDGLEAD